MTPYEQPDPMIHAPVRLAILSILVTVKEANFSYLKEAVNTTDGNLSVHISKLEDAGYIQVRKSFVDKKPRTTCMITETGRSAFEEYVHTLEDYLYPDKSQE